MDGKLPAAGANSSGELSELLGKTEVWYIPGPPDQGLLLIAPKRGDSGCPLTTPSVGPGMSIWISHQTLEPTTSKTESDRGAETA